MSINIDYDGLKLFLESLSYREIKNGALVEAHARNDIERFYKTDEQKAKITLNQVIEYGMPYMTDHVGNDLSICILTKRKHKGPTGRVVKSKFVKTVIHDCRRTFGSCLNGYYVIPERFISKEGGKS